MLTMCVTQHARGERGACLLCLTHAQRTVIYGVVIFSRNLVRTNTKIQNAGYKMTA